MLDVINVRVECFGSVQFTRKQTRTLLFSWCVYYVRDRGGNISVVLCSLCFAFCRNKPLKIGRVLSERLTAAAVMLLL